MFLDVVKGVKDMKILIKNKKWETSFKTVKLICNVSSENKIFNISFNYNGKNINIKTYNLDYTFKYLEKLFDSANMQEAARLAS